MGTIMRALLTLIAVTFALLGGVTATAQTPDGETPTNEAVCDSLIGLTPGLYGLCVAYCEAHDAHLLSPGGDLVELDVPNRKILENYNKKKTESDPPMPCVQQSCPCWTADQLSTVLPPSMNIDVNFPNSCQASSGGGERVVENLENGLFVRPWIQLIFTEKNCYAVNYEYPGGPPRFSSRLTTEEFESCESLLIAHANANKVDGVLWDCFAP